MNRESPSDGRSTEHGSLPPQHPALVDEPPGPIDPDHPSTDLLLWAYGHGIFPMGDPDTGEIGWFSPDPRAIIPLDPPHAFHVPRNLAREVRKHRFSIRSNSAFEQVIRHCARDRDPSNRSWINEEIIRAYTALHRIGYAHSVEAWLGKAMVGGLYGVQIGGAFFGESMFSKPDLGGSNASKICLVHLVHHLRARGFALLDTQFTNPHMEQFHCLEISSEQYLQRLHHAIRLPISWGTLQPLNQLAK